jgi:O-Antigen ligase
MPHARGTEAGARISAGALVLAAAIPLLFLHERYQPTLAVGVGSTDAEVTISDVAVLVVALAALWRALTTGLAPLRAGRWLWLMAAGLLAWIVIETIRFAGDANFAANAVTAAKFAEYAVLALAVPLLVRSPADVIPLVVVLVVWSALATLVATLQFFGTPIFDAWRAGWRQPSFVGHHDLAALSSASLALAFASIATAGAWLADRRLVATAAVAGGLGIVLSGSVAAAAGLVLAAGATALAARARFGLTARRAGALAAICAVVAAGVVAVRADPLADFLGFLGLRDDSRPAGVETYSQRTVLAYIGGRIFLDHPVVGVGWQRSDEPESFLPYVDDARSRFPDVVEQAFPAPGRQWGVQNLYVQAAAELGLVGLGLLVGVLAAGAALAWRAARAAAVGWAGPALASLALLAVLAGIWSALGMVAGIPLDAATWLALGLAAAAAAATTTEPDSEADA